MQGSNNITYIILSGYQVSPKPPQLGANTVYSQQYQILLSKGHAQPKPQQQFVKDLLHQVTQWHQNSIKVLLCLDANKDAEALNPIQELGPLIARTDLANAHEFKNPQ